MSMRNDGDMPAPGWLEPKTRRDYLEAHGRNEWCCGYELGYRNAVHALREHAEAAFTDGDDRLAGQLRTIANLISGQREAHEQPSATVLDDAIWVLRADDIQVMSRPFNDSGEGMEI